jgi:hypothetical protein
MFWWWYGSQREGVSSSSSSSSSLSSSSQSSSSMSSSSSTGRLEFPIGKTVMSVGGHSIVLSSVSVFGSSLSGIGVAGASVEVPA